MKLKVATTGTWKPAVNSAKRVKEGVAKMTLALEQRAKEAAERPSLPRDWMNRIIRAD